MVTTALPGGKKCTCRGRGGGKEKGMEGGGWWAHVRTVTLRIILRITHLLAPPSPSYKPTSLLRLSSRLQTQRHTPKQNIPGLVPTRPWQPAPKPLLATEAAPPGAGPLKPHTVPTICKYGKGGVMHARLLYVTNPCSMRKHQDTGVSAALGQ